MWDISLLQNVYLIAWVVSDSLCRLIWNYSIRHTSHTTRIIISKPLSQLRNIHNSSNGLSLYTLIFLYLHTFENTFNFLFSMQIFLLDVSPSIKRLLNFINFRYVTPTICSGQYKKNPYASAGSKKDGAERILILAFLSFKSPPPALHISDITRLVHGLQ